MKGTAVVDLMLGIENEIGWETGVLLRGIAIKRMTNTYRMVITVTTKKGKGKVAFIDANCVYACYEQLAAALYTTSITLKWYPDKYFGS